MNVVELVLKSSVFIAITYFLLQINFFSEVLVSEISQQKKRNLTFVLLGLSLFFLFKFSSSYYLWMYSLGILLGGRVLGFPYGSLISLAVFAVSIFLGSSSLRILLLGVISDCYHFFKFSRVSDRIKDLLISFTLSIVLAVNLPDPYLGVVIYTLVFYLVFWGVNNRKIQLELLQFKENELENARRARDSLQHLHSINKKMVANFDLEETCEELIKISCQQLGTESGGLLLLNEDKERLEMETSYGLGKKYVRDFKLNPDKDYLCQVIEDGEIFIVEDMAARGYNCYSLFIEDGFRSLLLAPIKMENKLKGLMFFVHEEESFFSNEDLIPIQTIVDQVPLVIQRAEIFQKMERNVANLSMLQEASQIINSTLEQQEVFDLTIDVVMGTLGVSMAGLLLYHPEEEKLDLVSTAGLPRDEEEQKKVIKETEEITLEIVKQGEVFIKDEVGEEIKDKFNLIDIMSVMIVPLKIRQKPIGAIAVAQTDYKRKFRNADRKFITTLANQVAVAIENARMYNQMEKMATKDGLTKLYNHSVFQERLREEIEAAKRYDRELSLLMMDIDNFKDFNDIYGHQAGDEILKSLAGLLQREVRTSDIAARYGGEEFTVILPEADNKQAVKIARRLNKLIRNMTINYNEAKLQVTVSVGVATYHSGETQEDLINAADRALYQAKENGKDQICSAEEINLNF